MKKIFIILGIIIFLALLIDVLIGSYLLKFTSKKIDPTVNHNIYDHDLKKSFNSSLEWVPAENYLFCTDQNSFRNFCENTNLNNKEFDIAIIGDSFTEGVGLEYKNTFVGQISNYLSNYKIANLGVVSYSPTIYFSKLKYLIDIGYKFNRVIIYFDISDVYDDNRKYRLIDNIVTRKKSILLSKIQKILKSSFPFLSYSSKKIKNDLIPKFYKEKKILNKCGYLDYCHEKSSWTFNDDYFSEKEINKSMELMNRIYLLLEQNNIKMSVGIYPWPGQIMHDNVNSNIVNLMDNFCLNRCEFFFNNFIDFFDEINLSTRESVVLKYYFENDVHFNEKGNEKIFKNFIHNFKN